MDFRSIGNRLFDVVKHEIGTLPLNVTYGAFYGFIGAQISGLPSHQMALACAIWTIAESALDALVLAFTTKRSTAYLLHTPIIIIGGRIAIQELSKRGLMNENMKAIVIFTTVFSAVISLCLALVPEAEKKFEKLLGEK